ncbi:uncharacterized mitochondrial protein AtMg00860-like [Gigantopelta aegis]|uniref:uncharacterized mitochondrial protein AtMg00860-like n=1 Tax=Gigantopelta aegis TaxID=1735272 RepID=UPI001B88883F|nr:uncharacterized mitochondrial protein AtMg00860-like [Gigantopelta aegis]
MSGSRGIHIVCLVLEESTWYVWFSRNPYGGADLNLPLETLLNTILTPHPLNMHLASTIVCYSLCDFNLTKCEFGKAQVTFLGHVVGLGKVAPITAKVDCILKYPPPTTRKEVRRFLGMIGYYRRFCPNFATVAAPITALLKKGTNFQWTEQCTQAFTLLKNLLCTAPIMAAPDYQKPFTLAVDASDVACGGVLFQEDAQGLDNPAECMPNFLKLRGRVTVFDFSYLFLYNTVFS